jgi:hypothetical protein
MTQDTVNAPGYSIDNPAPAAGDLEPLLRALRAMPRDGHSLPFAMPAGSRESAGTSALRRTEAHGERRG